MFYVWHFHRRSIGKVLICIILVILLVLLIILDIRLRPLVIRYALTEVKRNLTDIINEATEKVIIESTSEFGPLVNISTDSEGNVKCVDTNAAVVDRIVSMIHSEISQRLKESDGIVCRIKLGSLCNSPLLYGRGPTVTVRVQTPKSIEYEFESSFTEAGINQTKNSLYLNIRSTIITVIPGQKTPIEFTAKLLMSDTVIVGKVPDAYTEVIQIGNSDFDTTGTVVDYGQ